MSPSRRWIGAGALAIALLGLHCGGASSLPSEKPAGPRDAKPPSVQPPATCDGNAAGAESGAGGAPANEKPIQCRTSGPPLRPLNDADRKLLKRIDDLLFNTYVPLLPDQLEQRLKKALSDCETTCTNGALAKGHMYLGLLYGSEMGDLQRARDEFVLALRLAPNVYLDRDLATPEVVATFEMACKDVFPAGSE